MPQGVEVRKAAVLVLVGPGSRFARPRLAGGHPGSRKAISRGRPSNRGESSRLHTIANSPRGPWDCPARAEGPFSLSPNLSPPGEFSVGNQRQAEIVASEQKTPKTRGFSGLSEKKDKSDLNTPKGKRTIREIPRKSTNPVPARHKIRRSTDRAPSTHRHRSIARTWSK